MCRNTHILSLQNKITINMQNDKDFAQTAAAC